MTLFSEVSYCQNSTIRGVVYDSLSKNYVKGANIWLDYGIIGTTSDSNGTFLLENVPPGKYFLNTYLLGYSEIPGRIIHILSDSAHTINLNLPICKYIKLGGGNICPKCNQPDEVIPIVYGKPTSHMIKKAKQGKVKVAGCRLPYCAPRWFCKRDELEF